MDEGGQHLAASPPDRVPPVAPSDIRAEDTERARVVTELLRRNFAVLLKRVCRSIVVVELELEQSGSYPKVESGQDSGPRLGIIISRDFDI